MVREIGVVLKPGVPEAYDGLAAIRKISPDAVLLVEAEGHHAVAADTQGVTRVSARELAERAELVVVFGGDGTLIHAASLLGDRQVPILGVNLGRIGFLTDVSWEELEKGVGMALRGELPHSDRLRLDVSVERNGERVFQKRVLNDAVLGPHGLLRIATYSITLDGDLVTRVRGDGIIVSTPTGSTAYGMSAGGSILWPELEAIAVTPICPHQLNQRPLVIQPSGELRIALTEGNAYMTCDGQAGFELSVDDVMVVTKAPVSTRILVVPWRSYFEVLRTKLHWGNA